MDGTPHNAVRTMTTTEKILWACAALAGIAGLVLGPIFGDSARSVIIPLVIAAFIAAGAFAERTRRLRRDQPDTSTRTQDSQSSLST